MKLHLVPTTTYAWWERLRDGRESLDDDTNEVKGHHQ